MTESDPTLEDTAAEPAPATTEPPAFKDRKAGLIVFGVLLLLAALATLGSAVLQIVTLFIADSMDPEMVMKSSLYGIAALFYLLVAAGLGWLGIGSIRCRRWARALILVLSALTLASGLLSSVFLFSHFGTMTEMIVAETGDEEFAAAAPFVLGCVFGFLALVYIVLPAAYFLFYRSPHVKKTCEHYDPTPRWTDRYPAPLLAGILLLVFSGLILFAPLLGTPMPFFGALLSGVPAWIYAIVTGLLSLALAAGMARYDRRAWIGSIVFVAAAGLSAYLSFRSGGILEMYAGMDYPEEQIRMIESFGLTRGFSTWMLAAVGAMLVFLVWLGRYFGERRPAGS